MRKIMIGLLLVALGSLPVANAGKPPGAGGGGPKGGPGTAPPPNPDIVYMSANSRAVSGPAIRGFTLESNTDTELAKAKDGRGKGSIAWSPGGTWYAWIETDGSQTSSIFVAAPGQAPRVIYSAPRGDPVMPWPDGFNGDRLAWGPGCSGGSVLVFLGFGGPNESPQGIYAIDNPELDGAPFTPRLLHPQPNAGGFALSPDGGKLAFTAGYGPTETVSSVPMCSSSPITATPLLTWDDFDAPEYHTCFDVPEDSSTPSPCPCSTYPGKFCVDYPYPAVQSIDWSSDGKRLALSVTVGPDPDYPWRDLKIAYLQGSTWVVRPIDLDPVLGAASSEHSPQWGPNSGGDGCQPMAFSQSAGASDGSDLNGRRLFLLDVPASAGSTSDCGSLVEVNARSPRAIDWK